MRDPWLHTARPRGPWTWAERTRQLRALRVPADVCQTLCTTLQRWDASPEDLAPLLRLLRAIVLSNAVHRAVRKGATWAAGTARDPHYDETPEDPGALRPILEIVERIVADLERLINWEFTPPIVLHELDAQLTPTRRTVRLSRLDEAIRATFGKVRQELLGVRAGLREDTQRARGKKATLVRPYRVSAHSRAPARPTPARRRELARMVRDQLLALHPIEERRPRAAMAEANRLARNIIDAIPVLNKIRARVE